MYITQDVLEKQPSSDINVQLCDDVISFIKSDVNIKVLVEKISQNEGKCAARQKGIVVCVAVCNFHFVF